jgi:hypothetical protein
MNIIQGTSSDLPNEFESGHGNGKTTFCRLIRYCLGEKSFGQQHVVQEVKHCFPEGHVGAIVVLDGLEWAVIRHLGGRGRDIAKQGVSVAELIGSIDSVPYAQFMKQIENVGLAALKQIDVLSSGQSIQWLHLLAMCSRDQESRYDRFWNWRHVRSDSGSPKLTKNDASLCVRAILGILDPEETQLRLRQEQVQAELGQVREQIKEVRREPAYHVTRLRTALVSEFGVQSADTAALDSGELFDIDSSMEARMQELRSELAEIEENMNPLNLQINMATVQYREQLETQEQHEAASKATADGSASIVDDLDTLRKRRDLLITTSIKECKPGRILFGDCQHVREHLSDTERQLKDEQCTILKEVSERDQIETNLSNQARRLSNPLNRLRSLLDDLNDQKDKLLERRTAINELLRRMPSTSADLQRWHRILKNEEEYHALTSLVDTEEKKLAELESAKTRLAELLTRQDQRIKQIESRFHEIVQQTITVNFKGQVDVDEGEIAFKISRERSLAGEAYETLAIILADLSILLESHLDSVCHPGLLIHDSPREADLYVRLYERMLDLAFSKMSDDPVNSPFQYIVTTTTIPSAKLQTPNITKVALSSGNGSLFKMQLEAESPLVQPPLFDMPEEA